MRDNNNLHLLIPLKVANNFKCSLAVNSGQRISCCGQNPICFRNSDCDFLTSKPKIYAVPDVGENTPFITLINVVFPAAKKKIIQSQHKLKFCI